MTFRCATVTGEPTTHDTFVHCVLHRKPVVPEDSNGKFLSKTDAGKLAGQVGVQGEVASTNDQIANLIFSPKLQDGASREAGEAEVMAGAQPAALAKPEEEEEQ